MEIKTTHAIGDLVYIANAHDVDREVIKAIRITGLKKTISYGIKRKGNPFFGYFVVDDGYGWYKPSEVYVDKEPAIAHHENLKAKHEAEQAKDEAEQKAERKRELQAELAELEQGA